MLKSSGAASEDLPLEGDISSVKKQIYGADIQGTKGGLLIRIF
jgi:hypothetical protein